MPSLERVNLTVQAAASGGHVCLGRNGSGKTLLGASLAHGSQDEWIVSGSLSHREGWSARSSSYVSFESHEALLEEGGSVYRALGVPPGATPTKAAKFLLVRFGLHPLLYRPVTALSTGEIRKVMLARALATRPSLLVLDNAFDGLDVPSREALKELISTTLNGFGQLLVQGVDASATAHTQVLMFTHRAEEIVDEIASVSFLGGGVGGTPSGASCRREGLLYTEARDGRSADQLMRAAFEDRSEVRGAASRGLTPTVTARYLTKLQVTDHSNSHVVSCRPRNEFTRTSVPAPNRSQELPCRMPSGVEGCGCVPGDDALRAAGKVWRSTHPSDHLVDAAHPSF